jgi:hypothetical protein
LLGPFSRAFHVISAAYGWTDDQILDLPLRRIRQILAAITEEKLINRKNDRLIVSWQTRVLGMVIAASGNRGDDEELQKFVSNLTIDNEEYEQFKEDGYKPVAQDPKLPIHASTQEEAAKRNFDAAADKNSMDMLAMFGMGLEKGKPGHD